MLQDSSQLVLLRMMILLFKMLSLQKEIPLPNKKMKMIYSLLLKSIIIINIKIKE